MCFVSRCALAIVVCIPFSALHGGDLDAEIIREINSLRSLPASYATKLDAFQSNYEGTLLRLPNHIPIRTKEGLRAVVEAAKVLRSTPPLPLFTISEGLTRAARDHAEDLGARNATGHQGRGGTSPFTRMDRYGRWASSAGENIAYFDETAERILLLLLIDDGVASRMHRKNLLNPGFQRIGVATSSHPRFGKVTVMNFAGGYTEAGSRTR